MSYGLPLILTTISKNAACREKMLRGLGSVFKASHYYTNQINPSSPLLKPLKQLAT